MTQRSEDADNNEEGKARFSYFLRPEYHDRLKTLCKSHGLPVGDGLEVIIENLDTATIGQKLDERRAQRRGVNEVKSELFKKFQALTPEQLAMLEKLR